MYNLCIIYIYIYILCIISCIIAKGRGYSHLRIAFAVSIKTTLTNFWLHISWPQICDWICDLIFHLQTPNCYYYYYYYYRQRMCFDSLLQAAQAHEEKLPISNGKPICRPLEIAGPHDHTLSDQTITFNFKQCDDILTQSISLDSMDFTRYYYISF